MTTKYNGDAWWYQLWSLRLKLVLLVSPPKPQSQDQSLSQLCNTFAIHGNEIVTCDSHCNNDFTCAGHGNDIVTCGRQANDSLPDKYVTFPSNGNTSVTCAYQGNSGDTCGSHGKV